MNETINIQEPVREICELLSVYPADVSKLVIWPDKVEVNRHARNERGSKYVNPETNEPAMMTPLVIKVTA